MRKGDDFTLEWRESAERLLDGLFCYDDSELDSEEQNFIRERMYEEEIEDDEMISSTEKDIDEAINEMKTGKAPGWDRIEVVVLKRVWLLSKRVLIEIYNGC